jgi:hypothetical protein
VWATCILHCVIFKYAQNHGALMGESISVPAAVLDANGRGFVWTLCSAPHIRTDQHMHSSRQVGIRGAARNFSKGGAARKMYLHPYTSAFYWSL